MIHTPLLRFRQFIKVFNQVFMETVLDTTFQDTTRHEEEGRELSCIEPPFRVIKSFQGLKLVGQAKAQSKIIVRGEALNLHNIGARVEQLR